MFDTSGMTPKQQKAIRHELERARRGFAAAPPFTTVPVQRETMMDLITAVQDFMARAATEEPF
jgi:hypothetical protein